MSSAGGILLGELLESWGYRLIDRGSIALVECARVGCRKSWPYHRHELDPTPTPRVCWELGVHAGEHAAREPLTHKARR